MDSDTNSDSDLEELSKSVAKSLQELPYSDFSDEDMEPQPGPSGLQNPPKILEDQAGEDMEPQPGPSCLQNPLEILEDQAGASNDNEISNISINQEIGSVENDDFTVTYSRIPFKSNNKFDISDFHFGLYYSFHANRQNLLISSALQEILNALANILQELKQLFANQDRILYVTMLHEDLVSSVNIGPLNFANDSIQYMVEKMHIKLANILNSEKNIKADRHLTIKVKVLGKALK